MDPVTWGIIGVLISLDIGALMLAASNARRVGKAASDAKTAAANAEEAANQVAELLRNDRIRPPDD